MSITLLIVLITVATSIGAFNRHDIMGKLQFNPYQAYHRKEWYRIISHGFVHADWGHLIINMFVLYSFGISVERIFEELAAKEYISMPKLYYTLLYLGGIAVSCLTTLKKQKDNPWYNSVGASGAVSAVVFAHIFFAPWSKLSLYFLIDIPGIVFGILYLAYSWYMSRKNADRINHDAHFLGAVFGFIFPVIMDFELINIFIRQVISF